MIKVQASRGRDFFLICENTELTRSSKKKFSCCRTASLGGSGLTLPTNNLPSLVVMVNYGSDLPQLTDS